jgi:hypothetical protein
MTLPKTLQLDDEGYLCDERGILMRYDHEVAEVIVRRYNAHEALVQALRLLVELKDYREQHGKDEHYEQRKSHVWTGARAALEQVKEAE